MKINALVNTVPWFGKYSGYEQLVNYMPSDCDMSITISHDTKINRLLGKGVKFFYKKKFGPLRNDGMWAAFKFLQKASLHDVSHVLYADKKLEIFKEYRGAKKNLVGTIHFPFSSWEKKSIENFKYVKHGIILYKEEIETFSNVSGGAPLTFIQHGVDTNFFKPGELAKVKKNKILFVGSFIRNFNMFLKVYQRIVNDISQDFEFHMIIPKRLRTDSALSALASFKNVFFHENLTDEEMLLYYQDSFLMLMPMNDSGANTAIVQAISAGLPIITTDVGGIRSYGGGDLYPVIANNDDVSMTELFYKYYSEHNYRNQISTALRSYALEKLEWHKIASQHAAYYKTIINP